MECRLPFCTALGYTPGEGSVLSAVGGGGKTITLSRLAEELSAASNTVILTTTTHILKPPQDQMETITDGDLGRIRELLVRKGIACVGSMEGSKLASPDEDTLLGLRGMADALLVEADGAKGLPVKAPAPSEPVIYPGSGIVVAVAGLTALGRPLADCCFRLPYVTALLGVPEETILTPSLLAQLLVSKQGGRKYVAPPTRFTVLLNQADNDHLAVLGMKTAEHIRTLLPGCRVVIASLLNNIDIKAVIS